MIRKLLFFTSALLSALSLWGTGNVLAQGPATEKPLLEINERRTAFTKHFSLSGNKYQIHLSAAPLHFRDADGRWQEIDTRLHPRPDGSFSAEANGMRVYLPERSQGPVHVAANVFFTQAQSPSQAVSLSWQPLHWRYVDPSGKVDLLAQVRPVPGEAVGNTVTYAGILPQANESYRVIPNGLKHQVTLLTPPRLPESILYGEISLDYVGHLQLPTDLDLYADGILRRGDFTTDGPIEVRDRQGRPLLLLRAPFAYEAGNPRSTIPGSYAVWEEAGQRRLAWRLSAAWLLSPERTFPLVLDPTVEIPSPADDTLIFPGLSNQGSFPRLWVGHYSPYEIARSLLAWFGLGGIPAEALIDDDSNDVTLRLYLTGHTGDGGSQVIGIYNVNSYWIEREATWDRRFTDQTWTTPGGDYDLHLASASIGTTIGHKTWSSYNLRDEVALWRTYLYKDPIATYGRPPYGLLLKFLTETGREVKEFASKEEAAIPDSAPTLIINYLAGPSALTHQTPRQRRVPSPDYYSIPAAMTWKAVAVRADNMNADYDLELYRYSSYSSSLTKSAYGAGNVDLVAISPTAPVSVYYPQVYSANGQTGNYRIEYVYQAGNFPGGIDPSDSFGPYTLPAGSVVRLFSTHETADSPKCVAVSPISGNARLGLAVFQPGGNYYNRSQALVQSLAPSGGSEVSVCYRTPVTGDYGVALWSEGAATDTSFLIKGAPKLNLYLPLILNP